MEPRPGAQEALSADPGPADRVRFGLRLAAACAVLVGVAMVQTPGLLVPDTKFDLVLDPGAFLERALSLWDPQAAFGQLQNQAYGYLWPMGPFFLVGSLVDLPGWVVQRLWLALVMCVALTGAATLARLLGVRSHLACLVAGFAYALSPRMLTTLGPISIEAWPSALAPWVLVPLVVGASRGSPVLAAAWSALAVAMVGGVNAAATFAVLPLGAVWVLTRSGGARRRALLLWWPVFTFLGTLWWLVPLLLLGSYSPPFLDYIESAAITTFPTTPFDALRGTSNWVPYVDASWRAGNDLLRSVYLPVDGGVLLLFGIVGILRSRPAHRTFLVLGLVVGLSLVTLGHVGSTSGWGAPAARDLLDGVLAPLRNVHKFDPVVRLPLVLGLALLLDSVRRSSVDAPGEAAAGDWLTRITRTTVVVTALLAVVGSALPVLGGRLTPAGGAPAVPTYWKEAAAWLEDRPGDGVALLVPGSSFATYVWGSPRDEPLQGLAGSPWAVRNAIPLAPPGNIRMLDAVERELRQGRPSTGLAPFLQRAGVSHLVVRNDLEPSVGVPAPVVVHQALAGSPGLTPVAGFGPQVGGEAHLDGADRRIVVNGGWQSLYPAVEIWAVDAGSVPTAVTEDEPPVVVGGPEDLLDLAALGLLGVQPTVLATDLGATDPPTGPVVLTDGLRRAERNFGRLHDGYSATFEEQTPPVLDATVRDYLLDEDGRWSTSARLEGAQAVTASSSMADANAGGRVQPGRLPFAAVDGRSATAWLSSPAADGRPWWEVTFEEPRPVTQVTLEAGPSGPHTVQVVTENTRSEPLSVARRSPRVVRVDDPETSWLRVVGAGPRPGRQLGLGEVRVAGLEVRRTLVLPALPEGWPAPAAVVLRALTDARTGCVTVDDEVRCVRGRQVAGEEPLGFRREVTLPETTALTPRLTARPRGGRRTDRLLLRDLPLGVTSSSRGLRDPRASPVAAVDGDPGTTWIAGVNDFQPVLALNWLGERSISGIRVRVDDDVAARQPTEVTVIWPGGRRDVRLGPDGVARFRPVVTDRLSVRLRVAEEVSDLDFDGATRPVPVGVTELRLRGLDLLPLVLPTQEISRPCGSGPSVTVGGRTYDSAVSASPRALLEGGAVEARVCGAPGLRLLSGSQTVAVEPSRQFVPDSLVLSDLETLGSPAAASYETTGPARASVEPDAPGLLAVRRNQNPGWEARQGDRVLTPTVVDGWQQGWRDVEAEEPVRLVFAPNRVYQAGLAVGAAAFLLLVLTVALLTRRVRRRGAPPRLGHGTVPWLVAAPLAVLSGGVLAGTPGAAAAAAGLAAGTVLRRVEGGVWVVGAVLLPAAVASALRPWGASEGWAGDLAWPHYLVAVVVGSLWAWLPRSPLDLRTFRRRMAGSSTPR